ncbi:MAG: RNA 2',3'-cyclic phosphodiesterase, partial [Ignavibacteriales bacterium]|nr:RNA 2',3'-cyclic phosphodiesterase [Ignavibacteriales bacterium]
GDCTIEQTGEIEKYVQGLKGMSVIDTVLTRFGTFTRGGKPLILFAELANSPLLQSLQQNTEISMGQLGFPVETKKFHPHITLLRVKDYYNFEIIGKIASAPRFDLPFVINEICLYQSVLLPSGSKYVKKTTAKLQ